MLDGSEGAAPSSSPPSSTISISSPAVDGGRPFGADRGAMGGSESGQQRAISPALGRHHGASYGSPTQDLGVLERPPFVGVGRTAGLC